MAALDCVSKVQLHISCEGLIDKDVLSKSDAICAVYIWDESYKRFRWREVSENVPESYDMIFVSIVCGCFASKMKWC